MQWESYGVGLHNAKNIENGQCEIKINVGLHSVTDYTRGGLTGFTVFIQKLNKLINFFLKRVINFFFEFFLLLMVQITDAAITIFLSWIVF